MEAVPATSGHRFFFLPLSSRMAAAPHAVQTTKKKKTQESTT